MLPLGSWSKRRWLASTAASLWEEQLLSLSTSIGPSSSMVCFEPLPFFPAFLFDLLLGGLLVTSDTSGADTSLPALTLLDISPSTTRSLLGVRGNAIAAASCVASSTSSCARRAARVARGMALSDVMSRGDILIRAKNRWGKMLSVIDFL